MNIHLPNFLCFHNLQFQTMLNKFVCMYLYIIGCIPSRKSHVSGIIESKGKCIYIFVAKFPSGRIMIISILPSSKICECWLPHSLANRIWSYFLIFTNWEKLKCYHSVIFNFLIMSKVGCIFILLFCSVLLF